MILCFSACLSLPAFVAFKSYEFSISNEVKTNQEWITATSYNYPYIAICHPKFFNSQKLKGKCLCQNTCYHNRWEFIVNMTVVQGEGVTT